MKKNELLLVGAVLGATLAAGLPAQADSASVKHVLLLSIDGMHAVDLYNCTHGVDGVNSGAPYCPNLAALTHRGIDYVGAVSSKPSDSFPGLAALVTGGSPKSPAFTTMWRTIARSMRRPSPRVPGSRAARARPMAFP